MSVCTFFGHSDGYGLNQEILGSKIEELIHNGVDTFYVGHQGIFDSIVFHTLLALEKVYPHISVSVVLAYLPTHRAEYDLYRGYSVYPEIEDGPPRFAIERRNKWMINNSTHCIAFVNHAYGGAYKFAKMAKRKGLLTVNIGVLKLAR